MIYVCGNNRVFFHKPLSSWSPFLPTTPCALPRFPSPLPPPPSSLPLPLPLLPAHRGKEALSLSKYSPRAFCIFPSRSASLSRDFCTPGMFRMSITRGDLATFFIRARNSELILGEVGKGDAVKEREGERESNRLCVYMCVCVCA